MPRFKHYNRAQIHYEMHVCPPRLFVNVSSLWWMLASWLRSNRPFSRGFPFLYMISRNDLGRWQNTLRWNFEVRLFCLASAEKTGHRLNLARMFVSEIVHHDISREPRRKTQAVCQRRRGAYVTHMPMWHRLCHPRAYAKECTWHCYRNNTTKCDWGNGEGVEIKCDIMREIVERTLRQTKRLRQRQWLQTSDFKIRYAKLP